MLVNISPTNTNYYRQNNNEIDPNNVCKPTGTIEGLALAGWIDYAPKSKHKQLEDALTSDCRTKEAEEYMLSLDPSLKGTSPNEVWDVIKWIINEKWYKNFKTKPIIGPRWNYSLQEVLFLLTKGIPFVASTYLTKGGHVALPVGFSSRQGTPIQSKEDISFSLIDYIIVDDPYGNREKGTYDTTKTGWNNKYSLMDWSKVWRNTGIQINLYKE